MRSVIIYYLNEQRQLTEEKCAIIKEKTKADVLITLRAENQLEHLQYPYIDINDH